MEFSPKGSRQSMLAEEFRTQIQNLRVEVLGSLPPEKSGDSSAILAFGINSLLELVRSSVPVGSVTNMVWESLTWEGNVDVPTRMAEVMKEVICDVIAEFAEDRPDS